MARPDQYGMARPERIDDQYQFVDLDHSSFDWDEKFKAYEDELERLE